MNSVMRLAAVGVFFAAFAGSAWVVCPPPSAGPGLHPVGPQVSQARESDPPPKPIGPDLPPEPLDYEDIVYLNWRANDPGSTFEAKAAAVGALFTRYLRPPADLKRVRAVLTDPSWLAQADISRMDVLAEWVPVEVDFGRVFWVNLFAGHRRAVLLIRVSGRPFVTPSEFTAFLRGERGESVTQIEEFVWGDRTLGWGFEHYARHRRTIHPH